MYIQHHISIVLESCKIEFLLEGKSGHINNYSKYSKQDWFNNWVKDILKMFNNKA